MSAQVESITDAARARLRKHIADIESWRRALAKMREAAARTERAADALDREASAALANAQAELRALDDASAL